MRVRFSDSTQVFSRADIAFCSRGRGKGHAVPDLEILRHIRRLNPQIQVAFISYAMGAQFLDSARELVVDLELPAENDFLETTVRIGAILQHLKPKLVVSHEEFSALPAAKLLGLQTA